MRGVYDVVTLAEKWGCGTDTVRSLIKSGDLPAFKVGGKLLRVRAEEVEQYECRQITPSNDTETPSRSSGTKEEDDAAIRLARIIERPQRPQLVHSGSRKPRAARSTQ